MKSFLAILLVILLLATAGAAGYLLYQRSAAPAAAPPPADDSSASSQPYIPNAVADELADSTTDPAVLEKLMYEVGKNPDTVAWLELPGTDINNSVVQSHSNSYYLRRDERKQESVYGCYFADYECTLAAKEDMSRNTVIYGHSDLKDNPDGPKFSQLFRFADPAFAKENRTVRLSTPEATMEWEIFAAFYTDISFDYIRVDITPEVQLEITGKALEMSVHDYGIVPTGDDKILTLSTCSVRDGADGNHRFVLMARMKD